MKAAPQNKAVAMAPEIDIRDIIMIMLGSWEDTWNRCHIEQADAD